MWLRRQPTRARDLLYERFCLHGDKEGFLQLLLNKVARECRPEGQDVAKFCDKCHRHRAIRAMESVEEAVSTVRGLAIRRASLEHTWQFSNTRSRLLK